MKVIGFAGSNSKNSINKKLMEYVVGKIDSSDKTILDLNDFELPIFGIDLEKETGIPANATRFAELISSSDLIVVSLAEHNGSYSAVFKNLYDWVSRIPERKVWDGKKVLLMATSPGARGGAGVLEAAKIRFPRDGAEMVGIFSLPSFNDNFGKENAVLNTILSSLK
ncbi:MAG: chromate reductase [Psychromonas sp.]|jgi:chromate reductase